VSRLFEYGWTAIDLACITMVNKPTRKGKPWLFNVGGVTTDCALDVPEPAGKLLYEAWKAHLEDK